LLSYTIQFNLGFMHSMNYNWHVDMMIKFTQQPFVDTETENSSVSVKGNYLQIKREVLLIKHSLHLLRSKNRLKIIHMGKLLQLQGNIFLCTYWNSVYSTL
jgi:hypothetical protein